MFLHADLNTKFLLRSIDSSVLKTVTALFYFLSKIKNKNKFPACFGKFYSKNFHSKSFVVFDSYSRIIKPQDGL